MDLFKMTQKVYGKKAKEEFARLGKKFIKNEIGFDEFLELRDRALEEN